MQEIEVQIVILSNSIGGNKGLIYHRGQPCKKKFALEELWGSLNGNIHQRPYATFCFSPVPQLPKLFPSQRAERVLPPYAFPTAKWITLCARVLSIQVKTFNFCRPIWTGSCPDVRAQRPPRTVYMHLCSPHTIAIVMAKPCITAKSSVCVCYPRYYAVIKYLFKSLLRRASCCAALFNHTSGCFWILEARTSLPSGSWKLPLLTGMR